MHIPDLIKVPDICCPYLTNTRPEALPNWPPRSTTPTQELFYVLLLCFLFLTAALSTWSSIYVLPPLLKLFRERLRFNYHEILASKTGMAVITARSMNEWRGFKRLSTLPRSQVHKSRASRWAPSKSRRWGLFFFLYCTFYGVKASWI